MATRNWSALLDAIYATLRDVSTVPPQSTSRTQAGNQAEFDSELNRHRAIRFDPTISDDQFWQTINVIPYYGGVRPPAKNKIDAARAVLANYREVGQIGWITTPEAQAYIADKDSYWNKLPSKGPRIVEAARKLNSKQTEFGLALIDIVVPKRFRHWQGDAIFDVWRNMRSALNFGTITTYHAMMDLGIPVVKPDRMLVRTVVRLGLVDSFGNTASRTGREFIPLEVTSRDALRLGANQQFNKVLQPIMMEAAAASGRSIREVDWLFAKMGMAVEANNSRAVISEGREFVVCDDKPRCGVCRAHSFCAYGQKHHPVKIQAAINTQRSRKSKSRRIKPKKEQPV